MLLEGWVWPFVLSYSGTIATRVEDRRTRSKEMPSKEASLDQLNATERIQGRSSRWKETGREFEPWFGTEGDVTFWCASWVAFRDLRFLFLPTA
jgi:hypothetical protein